MELLVINEHDYSRFVKRKGMGWSRNDLDSEHTTRLKNGTMRRRKMTTKRKLSYEMTNMSRVELAQLDNDLSKNTVSVRYLDLHGVQTRTFYCSSFSAELEGVSNGEDIWDEAAFSITEV